MKIMVINGPNLNMVGVREKGIYGTKSFEEICQYIKTEGEKRGHTITLLQSNYEGGIKGNGHIRHMRRVSDDGA